MPIVPETILAARGLERRFGHVVALGGVDLDVAAGEVVLLAGANGAGKSTLLRCLAGLLRPSRGQVLIDGQPLRQRPALRAMIGLLSHQSMLYDDLTARENLRFAAALQGLDRAEQRVMDALDAAGLAPRADARVGVLSHGMRQRLSIARAQLHAPRLLLLDEPFNGLDASASAWLLERIAAAAGLGCAAICVTHQPADIWPLATRIVLMSRGAVVSDARPSATIDEFLGHYRNTVMT